MLESTLLNVMESLLKKHQLTQYQKDQLSKKMQYWSVGTMVYPGELKSKLNLSIQKTYEILEDIKTMGYLEENYEIYCFDCSKFKGKILKTLTDMPEDCTCDFCNKEFNPLTDTIMIFRVIKDGR